MAKSKIQDRILCEAIQYLEPSKERTWTLKVWGRGQETSMWDWSQDYTRSVGHAYDYFCNPKVMRRLLSYEKLQQWNKISIFGISFVIMSLKLKMVNVSRPVKDEDLPSGYYHTSYP